MEVGKGLPQDVVSFTIIGSSSTSHDYGRKGTLFFGTFLWLSISPWRLPGIGKNRGKAYWEPNNIRQALSSFGLLDRPNGLESMSHEGIFLGETYAVDL